MIPKVQALSLGPAARAAATRTTLPRRTAAINSFSALMLLGGVKVVLRGGGAWGAGSVSCLIAFVQRWSAAASGAARAGAPAEACRRVMLCRCAGGPLAACMGRQRSPQPGTRRVGTESAWRVAW